MPEDDLWLCAVHSKVFGAGMLYVSLSRCTTFDGLTVWPKIERSRLYANQSVIDFYRSPDVGAESDGMVSIQCPKTIADRVRGYIDALSETL